ncbi:3'(2'),5'-bisphosphate nucleotidase CysQ [Actinobacillus delphinicola]|uniref:3'(2'),5'-bisphosphate nucleotidase CysQ n=1 Tax=Actinobacillus delphinicola TaxID=51161 RepID=UPI00244297D4|nr:3'(2'),5'-bisphosphate nucleotidase CysQ [Actinobacillus delphinicola]MDG6897986.1 3'(2'),5'-bisphosphate nucleotidase CysQ [Actinobacillus delphinicola]
MQLTQNLISDIIDITEKAGQLLLTFYSKSLHIQKKQDHTPVTDADLCVNQFLTAQIAALTPNIPILSEESCDIPLNVRQHWSHYWLIDPLDGTQQFIDHTGHFGILIALLEKTEQGFRPILGVIHAPLFGKFYYAMKGQGAFKKTAQGIERLKPKTLNPNAVIKITAGSISTWKKLLPHLSPDFRYEFIPYGSSGLKATLVADNVADCYVRIGQTGEWDTAAADIILQEKGGVILDFHKNTPLTYNQRNSLINPDFIMLNSQDEVWEQIVNIPIKNS